MQQSDRLCPAKELAPSEFQNSSGAGYVAGFIVLTPALQVLDVCHQKGHFPICLGKSVILPQHDYSSSSEMCNIPRSLVAL